MSCEILWLENIPKADFKSFSALTTYHHFRADKKSPGIVFVKEYCDSMEKEFRLLKKRVVIDSSAIWVTKESSRCYMRQWYLYQEIWPFCYDNKDITCPKPIVPKPEITIVELFNKTRKCSYCKQTGHEKSRNGNICYPMMPNDMRLNIVHALLLYITCLIQRKLTIRYL